MVRVAIDILSVMQICIVNHNFATVSRKMPFPTNFGLWRIGASSGRDGPLSEQKKAAWGGGAAFS